MISSSLVDFMAFMMLGCAFGFAVVCLLMWNMQRELRVLRHSQIENAANLRDALILIQKLMSENHLKKLPTNNW